MSDFHASIKKKGHFDGVTVLEQLPTGFETFTKLLEKLDPHMLVMSQVSRAIPLEIPLNSSVSFCVSAAKYAGAVTKNEAKLVKSAAKNLFAIILGGTAVKATMGVAGLCIAVIVYIHNQEKAKDEKRDWEITESMWKNLQRIRQERADKEAAKAKKRSQPPNDDLFSVSDFEDERIEANKRAQEALKHKREFPQKVATTGVKYEDCEFMGVDEGIGASALPTSSFKGGR